MEICHQNISITEEDYTKNLYTHASWSFVVIFVPLVAAFGIVSNCSFIFVVYRVKSMRNVTNIYLINLAIADCSLLIAASIQYIGDYIISPKYDLHFSFYTAFGCSVPNFLIYLSYNASLWTITLVSFERYLATCHIFWHRLVANKSRAIRLVLLVWIISLIFGGLATPYTPINICVLDANDTVIEHLPYCDFVCNWCEGALYLTDCILFSIALIVNITMYCLIIHKLSNAKPLPESTHHCNGSNSRRNLEKSIKTRNAVAKMLIINGCVFFICLTPFSIANIESIFQYFHGSVFADQFVGHLGWAGRVLFLLNSALNPLLYNVSNPRYRAAFQESFSLKETRRIKRYMSLTGGGSIRTSLTNAGSLRTSLTGVKPFRKTSTTSQTSMAGGGPLRKISTTSKSSGSDDDVSPLRKISDESQPSVTGVGPFRKISTASQSSVTAVDLVRKISTPSQSSQETKM